MKKIKFKIVKLFIPLMGLLIVNSAFANVDSYFPEFAHDKDMLMPSYPENFSSKGIQFGGWTSPLFLSDSDSDSTSFSNTLRLWGRVYLWDNSSLYVRGKHTYTRTDQDSVVTSNIIDLDIAMLDAKFLNDSIRFSLGRKYFLIGSGFLLNGRGDGAQLEWFNSILNVDVFGTYTGLLLKDDNPYNLTNKDYADGAERLFAGGRVGQTFFNQNLYFIGMIQKDLSKETSESKHYNSNYYGVGLRGFLPGGFDYMGEFFYENGSTYNYADGVKADINAMAAIATLNWNVDLAVAPILTLQYAYGSGGDDERGDSTTPNGNASDIDKEFFTFGTFLGGYGLRPVIGNLHVFRVGLGLSPFRGTDLFFLRDINIIAKYSYYMKDNANSPVGSYYSGVEKSGEKVIGQGIDASIRWRVFSDLSFFANYGLFMPGAAYEDDSKNNTFFMAGMSLSF